MNLRPILSLLALGSLLTASAQPKRALTFDDIMDYQHVTHRSLSDDGRFSLIVHEGWRGDGDRNGRVKDYAADATALLFDAKGQQLESFFPINAYDFTRSSQYLVVKTRETEAHRTARELKLQNSGDEKKDKDVQLDTLHIYQLATRHIERIDSVRNHKLAGEADYIAYQLKAKDSTLYLRALNAGSEAVTFDHVTDYGFSTKGKSLYFTVTRTGKPDTCQLYVVALPDLQPRLVKEGVGQKAEGMAWSEDGQQLAFLWGSSDKKLLKGTGRQLWYAPLAGEARQLSDSVNSIFPRGFVVSPNGKLSFSRDGSRLYFGTALAPRQTDTLTLKANRPNAQVWSSNEPVQYTVQSFNFERDSKRTYQALCWLNDGKLVQLADSLYPEASFDADQNGRYALLRNSNPYSNSSMWEGRTRSDYSVIDLQTGARRLVSEADYTNYRISPTGRYAYGYNATDSCWWSIDLTEGQRIRLTSPQSLVAWDEEDDHPDYPEAYGAAGWLTDDKALIVYDRYDLWSIPAQGGSLTRLTTNGRELKRQYRLLRLDPEKARECIDPSEMQWLRSFDETTKGNGYYSMTLARPAAPRQLYAGLVMLDQPTLAKSAPVVLWTQSTFEQFPDVRLTQFNAKNLTFRQTLQLTHLQSQQAPFYWGTAEPIQWTSYKGIELEGILFKPEGFDPSQKYPLIVYYYERNSETLFNYQMPQPQRSIIDFHAYTSDGYVVFVPDIRYTDGHPGESAYDCIMSGLDKVESLGFVDKARIGTCGHSWGGYQSAYLATRTNRFAAIESGAPVVNMFSAYGGIRWGSGLARSFQYEHTQSRLGTTMWEHPEIYAENSSLLHMDRVETPILIMHNDTDGHVPWYQGIEMFVALKRLGKTAWMINYTGEPHWPVRMANRKDWCMRMKQFFDHYLKGAPAPRWMTDGVPAVDQPYDLGY